MSNNSIFESLMDNPDVRHAVNHHVESQIAFHAIWDIDWYLKGKLVKDGPEPPNTFTTEGINRMLDILFYTASKGAELIWKVGVYKNNVTPAVGHTAADCLGAAGTYGALQGTTDFTGSAYPSYQTASAADRSITNSATQKAEYIFAGSFTCHGVFLGTASDPTSTSGYLMSAKKLTNAKPVDSPDGAAIGYTITVTTS